MESINFSKARALFNFLSHNFHPYQKIGELSFKAILEIVVFIESDEFKQLSQPKE
ncbi:MAG: hypothetical protein IJ730_04780 [Alphaproteobacteria bacterium]|nr:hypothetical protein [Alphaproteobacteria bacterium]MBR2137539.1 hypothetical protein [Alphaproteobacteria bacterium]